MGEMVRRLEYERRAKTLVKHQSRDKLTGREFTQPVRAANVSVSRSLESTVKKVDDAKRVFRNRYSKSLGNIYEFQRNLSSRSLKFTDDKFNSENRLLLPPITSGVQDGGGLMTPDMQKPRLRRRQSGMSIASLLEEQTGGDIKPDDTYVPCFPDGTPTDSARRGSTAGRRASLTEGRSFRVLKDKFTAPQNPESNPRTRKILDCKAAEHRRGSLLHEKIQNLYQGVEQS
ncbi:uncharacterized protein LOC124151878 [Haliotis rufescens]|uniref:uncharacterized protein LOC124151878 n=1 Tax=Haliotis rufescens TaxID=6454 RepID=UPI001EB05E25|nr:uncharacterized protein LOC124151878 [Haliotis rufescens]